jgi:post-segregation antitoxin (ccd killing protein)
MERKAKPRATLSIRIRPELLEAAKAAGMNMSLLLEQVIEDAMGEGQCPLCKSKVKFS